MVNADEDDDSSSEKTAGLSAKPSHAEEFSAFKTGLEWYEMQKECCPTPLLAYRVTSIRQPKIKQLLIEKP